MAEKKITSPKLPKTLTHITSTSKSISDQLREDEFESEGQLSLGIINDCLFDLGVNSQDLRRVSLNQVMLKNVKFTSMGAAESSGGLAPRFELVDVRLEDCDLSNVNLSEAIIHRTEFINCKIYGINLNESTLRNVFFLNCHGDYGSFRFSDCKRVGFNNCQLCHTDFQQCSFDQVYFNKNAMIQAQFSGTILEGIDFSDCQIEGISVRAEDLKGAIVSPLQAVLLSRLLGLVVKE